MPIENWKPLNKEQAEALFAEHAILAFDSDGIPVHIAAQILSPEAVACVRKLTPGKYWNSAGLGGLLPDVSVYWLTKAGFMYAVSEMNCLYMWPGQREEYLQKKAEWERREAEEEAAREAKRKAARERRKAKEAAKAAQQEGGKQA